MIVDKDLSDAYNDGYRDACRKVEYLEGQIKALSETNEMLVKNMANILAQRPPQITISESKLKLTPQEVADAN